VGGNARRTAKEEKKGEKKKNIPEPVGASASGRPKRTALVGELL
jgi:hypothetical protein